MMPKNDLKFISQINNWETMVLIHELQLTQSWEMFSIIEYENPAGVWHVILGRHACEGLKCQQEWVDCPVPELAGAEINININQLENG